ncbi:MAG TPA: carboxypeptidase-like regulatory domain-containing protein, partial [Thermoanaerobaculia bacterium]
GADPKTDEARFFSQRPIAAGGSSLDFGSLPVGGWDLRVESPGRSKPRKAVNVSDPGVSVDLGDVYLTDLGKLRVVLEFPDEVPPATFEVKLTSSVADARIDLGSRTVRASPEAAAEFADMEPGDVDIECSSKEMHIWRTESAVVEPNRTAETRIVIHPLNIHGTVRHGDQAVAGAQISWLSGRKSVGEPPPVTSDALGAFTLKAWAGEDRIGLATLPPGEKTEFVEFVEIEPESTDIPHDVLLPANEIRGVVRDAATGATLEGASVVFVTALDQKEPDENAVSFVIQQKTDADGRFRLANLTEAAVDVAVSMPGYSSSKFPTVRPTAAGADLDVRLGKGGRVFGIVTDETGAPLPAVMVGLDVEPQGQFFAETATTAGDGSYEFRGVSSGSHVLGLIRCASTIVWRPFVVDPDSGDESGDQRQDVQFGREGAPLTVRFVKADGTPAEKKMLRWAIDGVGLPAQSWYEVVRTCGYAEPAETDRLVLRGFPPGSITALSFYSQKSFGTFVNDGSQAEWIIRLPAAEEKRGERVAQGIPSPSD